MVLFEAVLRERAIRIGGPSVPSIPNRDSLRIEFGI
jgi:hypothetical protein